MYTRANSCNKHKIPWNNHRSEPEMDRAYQQFKQETAFVNSEILSSKKYITKLHIENTVPRLGGINTALRYNNLGQCIYD